MGLVLLVLSLGLFAGVVALGVWGMVRMDDQLSGSPDSVLAQWVAQGRVPSQRQAPSAPAVQHRDDLLPRR